MLKKIGLLLAAALVSLSLSAAEVAVVTGTRNDGYALATWTALAKNSNGTAVNAGAWRGIKTVQIVVTGAGEQSLSIQGSMDGTNWVALHGISLSSGAYVELAALTTSQLVAIIEDPLYIRPLITNDAGATAVDIDVILGSINR